MYSGETSECDTFRGRSIDTCIVVRHLSPADEQVVTENGASEGTTTQETDAEAKRPCRKLKVKNDYLNIAQIIPLLLAKSK